MPNLANGRVKLKSNFNLNLYVVYELNTWPLNPVNTFTLKYCLFGTVKLTRNANKSKFAYNGGGIESDGDGFRSFDIDSARNVVIFGNDNSSSCHTDNWKNKFLVLGEGSSQGINDSTGAADKHFSVNFSKANTKFCLSLHYNSDESYLHVIKQKFANLKRRIT